MGEARGARMRCVSAKASRWAVDFDEYLRFEQEAAQRHELIAGEIVAMAGATRRHNLLCGRLHDALRPTLGDGPCILERSDQRLAVESEERAWVGYYPDLAIYRTDETRCGRARPRCYLQPIWVSSMARSSNQVTSGDGSVGV